MDFFCGLLVVAALVTGIILWVRQRNRDVPPAPIPHREDRARDQAEAERANRTVGPADVVKAEAVVDGFARALGNSDAVYSALANISRAGGAGTYDEVITSLFNDPAVLDRPWWWLAATAEQALRENKQMAAAKIGTFTEMFTRILVPRLDLAGQIDAGLGKPPAVAHARIGAAALGALEHMPPERAVLGQTRGYTLNDGTSMDLTAGAIERQIATTLLDLQRGGTTVAPAGLERARAVIAGQRGPVRTSTAARASTDAAVDEVIALVHAGKIERALAEGARQLGANRVSRGEEDPASLRAAAALGFAQLRAGQLYEVEATLDPVYPVALRVLGGGDFTTLRIAFCLSSALRDTRRPERARDLLQPAIEAAVLSLGADDATTMTLRCELAATLTTLGEHEQAVALHRQVLAERTRVLGPDHRDTLTSGDHLGRALDESGDLDAAIAQYEATTTATRAALGPEHPDTLSSQNSLASAYGKAGRSTEAIALYEQTLAARRRVLGPAHIHTLNSMNHLALAYLFDSDRRAQGLALLEEAADLARGSLAAGHPLIANLETSLLMARAMAAPPPAADAPPTPARRVGSRGPLRELVTLASPSAGISFDLAWSPDGDRLAVAGFDDSVVVYDAASGATVAQSPKLGTVGCVAWSPDGATLAAGTSQRTIHLFDAATGAERQRVHGHRDEVRSIAFSPSGQLVATCANDGTIGIWRAVDLSAVTAFSAHEGLARSIAWSPDGSLLASGGGDGPVRTWHTGSWLPGVVHSDHAGTVSRVAFSQDGRFLATGSLDSTARVYDLRTNAEHRVLSAEGWWVVDLAFSPDSGKLAMLTTDDVLVFDLATGEVFAHGLRPFGSNRLSWGSHGRLAAAGDTKVVIWALPE